MACSTSTWSASSRSWSRAPGRTRPRCGSRSRHRALRRHRRLDAVRERGRRRDAGAPPSATSSTSPRTRIRLYEGTLERHDGRRRPGDLRRAGASDPLRRAICDEARLGGVEVRCGLHAGEVIRRAGGPRRARRAHRRSDLRPRRARRGARDANRPRPRRRARGSRSRSAASTSSRACPTVGRSTRSTG